MPTTNARYSRLWIVFVVFVVFVYLFGLTVPLLGPDEPRYAQVAREMFLRSDWVTPTLGGHNWFEKPALLYWLQITFFNIFGVSEFAARLGSALFGLGTVAALWILGRRFTTESTKDTEVSDQGSPKSDPAKNSVLSFPSVAGPAFANILFLVAASSLGLLVFARGASFDIIVTFPLTAAMVGYFVHDHDHRTGKAGFPLGLVAFYFFIGLAVLAKGLIGILFPFAIVTFYHVLSRRMPSRSFIASVFWGIPISAAIVATWYLPMYLRNGWEFIDEFIIQHHFQRFTSNKYQHPQPFHFFWWVLPLMTFPWIPFFFGGLWRTAKMFINDLKTPTPTLPSSSTPLLLYSLSWLLVPLVFFSFSGSKLPGYILPALPPAIVISAFFAWQLAAKKAIWRRLVPAVGVVMLLVVFLTLAFALPRFADRDSVRPLIAAADARGMATQRVLMFYHLSHNAEFYAVGRLLRDQTEKQRVFYKTEDLLTILAAEPEGKALVISPVEHVTALTADRRLNAEVVKDNTEHAIVAISLSTPGT
jgi:4-amino-4-deoxy-L-arabinose transferase-like glycosyltransferase